MTLQRLVLDYRTGELVVRCLYRTTSATSPGPDTKARRRREVTDLVRTGLQDALEQLQGDVEMVGTSGFTTREDVLCTEIKDAPESLHKKLAKGAR